MGPQEEADPGRGGPLPDRGPGLPHPPQGPIAPAAAFQQAAPPSDTHSCRQQGNVFLNDCLLQGIRYL